MIALTRSGPRLAWRTEAQPTSTEHYVGTVDASSGSLIDRHNLVRFATGAVWRYAPTDLLVAGDGTQLSVDFTPWLSSATALTGPNAHVYPDANDDNTPDGEVGPTAGTDWSAPFTATSFAPFCLSPHFPCSWDPRTADQWQVNIPQNGAQVFYFVNTFHDFLRDDPGIRFTTGAFEGSDPLNAEIFDGAGRAAGLPDGDHINNANMDTGPDGVPPRMQMYLFAPLLDANNQVTFAAGLSNGGDEAAVVYHEYAHGLSSRLIITADGFPAVDGTQSGAMGEAWSDFYALDYLVGAGIDFDTAAPGDVNVAFFTQQGNHSLRSEGLDCAPADTAPDCPGTAGAGAGGYTFGDLGKLHGSPEVHDDGEIWGQTLWSLRTRLLADHAGDGQTRIRKIVTDGMRLAPPYPSFLDARNAIVQAAIAAGYSDDVAAIWQVFAGRGMGWFASTVDGFSPFVIADSSEPPAPSAGAGTISGRVVEAYSAAPIRNVYVGVGGHGSGRGYDALDTVTTAAGTFSIAGVAVGTYPQIAGSWAPHFFGELFRNVAVANGATRALGTVSLTRDWLADGVASGTFTGPDHSAQGCGPGSATDATPGTGWISSLGAKPKVTLRLARRVDIAKLYIDPSDSCSGNPKLAVKNLLIETSQDGKTWTVAASATFANSNPRELAPAPAAATGVRFVRYTMKSRQGSDATDAVAMDELWVEGGPALADIRFTAKAKRRRVALSFDCGQPCRVVFTALAGRTAVGRATSATTGPGGKLATLKARRGGALVIRAVIRSLTTGRTVTVTRKVRVL